jgi:hypothetical protein
MNRNKLILIIGLAFLVGSCASSLPPPKLTRVKGVLIDATNGRPVENASVQLWRVTGVIDGVETSSDKQPISETTTDDTGSFLLIDVSPSRYLL